MAYKKQVTTVGAPRQTAGGNRGNAGMLASAQANMSLAQKLSNFSGQLQGIAGNMAQDQAGKDAVRDIHKRKQEIADINNSTKLTQEEKLIQVSKITTGTESKFSGIYSRAYDRASTAAYSNQITVDTASASNQAMIASEGDSESYIKQMNAFRDETVPNAPTKETAIVAEMAINQYGGKNYKTLKMAEIREEELKRKNYHNSTVDLQTTDIMSNMQEGDWVNGSQNLFKLEQTLQDGIKNEWTNTKDAELIMMKTTEGGILSYAKDRIVMLEPIEAQKFIKDFREGNYEKEIPTEFYNVDNNKLADRMEYLLDKEMRIRNVKNKLSNKQDFEDVKDVIYLLDQGEEVAGETLEAANNKVIKPETRVDLLQAIDDNGYMKFFDTKNLESQRALILELKNKEDKTADELRLQKKYEEHYKTSLKEINSNSLAYGQGKAFDTELEDINLQDPDYMSKAENRIKQVKQTSEYINRDIGFFQKKEVQDINSRLPVMSSEQKMDFVAEVNKLPEDMRVTTFRQFKNELGFAGELYIGGNPNAARISLQGKGAEVTLATNFKKDVQAKLSNVYAGHYDKGQFNMALEGIQNYAKGMMLQGEELSYSDAVEQSVGVVSKKWNNKSVLLPQGVQSGEFEDVLDNIVIKDRPVLTKGLNDMTDYFRSGDYQLISVSPGKYKIKVLNNGNPYIVADGEEDFVLNYNEYTQ